MMVKILAMVIFLFKVTTLFTTVDKTKLEEVLVSLLTLKLNILMLYGSEKWCWRENEMAILRRTERAMVRAMCGAKLMEKKRTEDLM